MFFKVGIIWKEKFCWSCNIWFNPSGLASGIDTHKACELGFGSACFFVFEWEKEWTFFKCHIRIQENENGCLKGYLDDWCKAVCNEDFFLYEFFLFLSIFQKIRFEKSKIVNISSKDEFEFASSEQTNNHFQLYTHFYHRNSSSGFNFGCEEIQILSQHCLVQTNQILNVKGFEK